jgi:hypothetical protein
MSTRRSNRNISMYTFFRHRSEEQEGCLNIQAAGADIMYGLVGSRNAKSNFLTVLCRTSGLDQTVSGTIWTNAFKEGVLRGYSPESAPADRTALCACLRA